MVYCSKCGKKNEDDAEFCAKCGAALKDTIKDHKKSHDDRCEEECAMGEKSPISKYFWGAVVIIIGLWIIFALIIPRTEFADNLPSWLVGLDFWLVIGIIVAIAFIITGIRIVIKK